jgi:phage baseplate assembly protein W
MKSIEFPRMFTSSSTNVTNTSLQATMQNILSLLGSEKREFTSDPDYGISIKRYMFEQNNFVLRDIIIDEIYTQISIFIPQVIINRKDIRIRQSGIGRRAKLEATIKVTNRLDFTTNMFDLVLFNNEE